jgi:hypothetical protein
MQRWRAEAWPILMALMGAEDKLISGSEAPAVVIVALCDQLDAAVSHAQSWISDHRCPDIRFGVYCNELISASRGMRAIMQLVAAEAPSGDWIGNRDLTDKVAHNLVDRIEQATKARSYLRLWEG